MVLFVCFVAILLADVFSKYFTYHFIPSMDWLYPTYPYGGVPIFNNFFGIHFSLNYVENRGGAWGLFSSIYDILLTVRIILVIALGVFLLFYNQEKARQFPFVLVLAGAIGNILDCFIYGHVIDMFHFVFWNYSYPVFNIADMCICCGVGLLIWQAYRAKNHKSSYASF